MKRNFKILIISLAMILLLNTVLFSILTVYQAPYYDEAPSKVDSIYELYASETYDNATYYKGALEYISEEAKIQKIENLFKSTSIVKLNKFQSFLKMFSLNRKDFVFITFTDYDDYGGRKTAAEKLVASNIIVYLENDEVYIACVELMEYAPDTSSVAMYKVTNNEELVKLLSEYKTGENNGWKPILPEWREDISEFPKTYNSRQYGLFLIIEFIVVVLISNRIIKDNKKEKVSAKYSKKSKKK